MRMKVQGIGTMPRRIAIFHNLPSGGGKRALYEFTRCLYSKGMEMDLYILGPYAEEYLPLKPFMQNVCSLSYTQQNVRGQRGVVHSAKDIIKKWYTIHNLLRLTGKLAERINSLPYDLVFVHSCRHVIVPMILRALKHPSVYYCQEPLRGFEPEEGHSNDHPQFRSYIQRILRFLAIRVVFPAYYHRIFRENRVDIRSSTLVLANSFYSKEYIFKTYGVFPRVVYLGVDAEKFSPTRVQKDNLVLSVGRLTATKQHHTVLEAISRIPSKFRPALALIGDFADPVYKEFLTQRAHEISVKLYINELVTDEDLVDWYNRARVVTAMAILEPFGLTPLESMACETPVVAIKEGGYRESLLNGTTGLFVEDRDPENIAAALTKLLSDPALCIRMGQEGRRYVLNKWTWEKSTESLLQSFALAAEMWHRKSRE